MPRDEQTCWLTKKNAKENFKLKSVMIAHKDSCIKIHVHTQQIDSSTEYIPIRSARARIDEERKNILIQK